VPSTRLIRSTGYPAFRVVTVRHNVTNQNRAKLLFLVAAGLSFLLSVGLWFRGHHEEGLFVGIWVPSILALGALMQAGGVRK